MYPYVTICHACYEVFFTCTITYSYVNYSEWLVKETIIQTR